MAERAERVIRDSGLSRLGKPHANLRVIYKGAVARGVRVADAHATWNAEHLARVATPDGFPRLAEDSRCADGVHLVEMELVEAPSGGMSSYYGFRGLFLSILLDVVTETLLDVRSELAS